MASDSPKHIKPDAAHYFNALHRWGYDELTKEVGWPTQIDGLVERLFGQDGASRVGRMLVLGAGTGLDIAALRKHGQPAHITAVDISPDMLAEVAERFSSEEVDTVVAPMEEFVADCRSSYDLVLSMGSLEYVRNLPDFLGQMHRILEAGGVFAGTYPPRVDGEPSENYHESVDINAAVLEYRWLPSEVENGLANGGLVIVDQVNDILAYEMEDEHYSERVTYNFVAARKPIAET